MTFRDVVHNMVAERTDFFRRGKFDNVRVTVGGLKGA
jgi:hypothetical protein